MEESRRGRHSTKEENEEKIILTKEQLADIVKKASAEAIEDYIKTNKEEKRETFTSYTERPDRMVELLYLNKVSSDNITYLDHNKLYFVKQLGDRILIPFNVLQSSSEARDRIKSRKLIVLNGLNEYEKKLFGCDYKEGEVLKIEFINNLLDLPKKDIIETYKALCVQHRRIVAELLREKFVLGDYKVSGELVKSLIKISKKDTSLPSEYKYDEKILRDLLKKIDKASEDEEDEIE